MGRRSVWSDPGVRSFSERFFPVADEVWRLQRGSDAECKTFQAMADGGHYRGAGTTRQGIYVCTPAGKLLASVNANDPTRVLATLRQGWEAWEALPEDDRWIRSVESLRPAHRWEQSFPEGGLVLESACRDLAPERTPNERWNRDHVWFARDEVPLWLPPDTAGGAVDVGFEWELPELVTLRLAQFHLVDNVRGQSVPFARAEVERANLTARVESADEETLALSFRGATRAHAPGPWQLADTTFRPKNGREYVHGVETELVGRAVFDRSAGRFTSFELVAAGDRWGFTENNGRRNQAEKSPVGFAFRLAPETPAARVSPAFVQVYGADWVRRP